MAEDRTGEYIILNAYMDDFIIGYVEYVGYMAPYYLSYKDVDVDYFQFGSPGRRSDYDCDKGYLFET